MLINWAHKGCLSTRNGKKKQEKRKIYKPVLCGILRDLLALPLPYCGNGLSLPRLPKLCACVIMHIVLPTHKR